MSDEQPATSTEESPGTAAGRRVIELLWDPPGPPARGPKPKLALDQVVAAGMELAAKDGLAVLSMRKVATHLGVGAMSLYTYVPGRTELVELMLDKAYAGHRRPDPDDDWRTQVEFLARESLRIFEDHPWIVEANLWRMPMGPHVLDYTEAMYRALATSGLAAPEVVRVAQIVAYQLYGVARTAINESQEVRRTGVSAEEYWNARMSVWETYFDPARFPTMNAMYLSGGFDDDIGPDPEFALARLLDGVERYVDTSPTRLDPPLTDNLDACAIPEAPES